MEDHLLLMLNRLWNIDKHQHINVTGQFLLTETRFPAQSAGSIEIRNNQREIIVTVPQGIETDKHLKPQLSTGVTEQKGKPLVRPVRLEEV